MLALPEKRATTSLSPKASTFAEIGMIAEKMRLIMKSRGIADLRELFAGRTETNLVEFKNVVSKLGLTSKEIIKLCQSITFEDFSGNIDLRVLQKKIDRIE